MNENAAPVPERDSAQVLETVLALAEKRLDAQLQSAIAADQRAITFLGFLFALIAFLLGAAVAAATGEKPSLTATQIALTGAAGLTIAGFSAYLAGRPVGFWFAGNEPDQWFPDVDAATPYSVMLRSQLEHYNSMINDNHTLMADAASYLRGSVIIVGMTTIACGIWAALVFL